MNFIGRNTLLLALTCAALGCLTPGCGGDDDGGGNGGGGGDVDTSVDGSAVVGDLSQEDFDTLCEDMRDFFASPAVANSAKDFGCKMSGVFVGLIASGAGDEATLRSACSEAYDACVDAENMAGEEEPCTRPSSACTATVAELTACVESYPTTFRAVADDVPACNELTLDSLDALPTGELETSAPCQVIEEKCPGVGLPAPQPTETSIE